MWYVYILECKNNQLYIGLTDDICRRCEEHQKGRGARFTRLLGVRCLLYYEVFDDKQKAVAREAQLKRWSRVKKMALISGDFEKLKKV